MAISRSPVYKRCSYLGINPIVLGYTHKPSIRKNQYPRRKISEYGLQLKEKQKLKFIYGVSEKQFRLTYDRAEKIHGVTGENLLKLLELRFDNVVYRLGLATTRRQARQMVVHGYFRVNGKRMDIPSYTMSIGDCIRINESYANFIRKLKSSSRTTPMYWLAFEEETMNGTVLHIPRREDIDFEVKESAIVELYSK